jgi:hypothetical protein
MKTKKRNWYITFGTPKCSATVSHGWTCCWPSEGCAGSIPCLLFYARSSLIFPGRGSSITWSSRPNPEIKPDPPPDFDMKVLGKISWRSRELPENLWTVWFWSWPSKRDLVKSPKFTPRIIMLDCRGGVCIMKGSEWPRSSQQQMRVLILIMDNQARHPCVRMTDFVIPSIRTHVLWVNKVNHAGDGKPSHLWSSHHFWGQGYDSGGISALEIRVNLEVAVSRAKSHKTCA